MNMPNGLLHDPFRCRGTLSEVLDLRRIWGVPKGLEKDELIGTLCLTAGAECEFSVVSIQLLGQPTGVGETQRRQANAAGSIKPAHFPQRACDGLKSAHDR